MNQKIMSQINVRRKNFDFPKQIDRYWFGTSPFKTHLLNSLTLLLPDIEQYIIQNVRRQLKQLDKPQLKQEVRAFIAQEAQHSTQHTKFWDNLRLQGYEFGTYVRLLRAILFKTLERRLSTRLNLSIIAGIEHLTTLIAEVGLEGEFLAEAEPKLRKLFEWHAVEEIEHKSVAYDVLQNATDSYLVRLVGMLIADILVLGFLNLGVAMMLYQDKKLLDRKVWQEMIQFWFTKEKFLSRALLNCVDYFKKGFHPSQRENLFLIKKVTG
jgi:hypothetical protein